VVDHRATDPAPAGRLRGVHRFDLRVLDIEPLERPDRQQFPADAEAEERDRGIEELSDLERVVVLGRALRARVGEVTAQQRPHIVGAGVVDRE
jgi:hypothetical protein